MPSSYFIKSFVQSHEGRLVLADLYPAGVTVSVIQRICDLADAFVSFYGENENISVFSTPGRTELGGNHTDHNHGRVLAASVDLDTIAVAAPNSENIVNLKSEGYPVNFVDLSDLNVHEKEYGNSNELIRGVCASFAIKGMKIGGFNAVTASNVIAGSGLSSSAAFEVLLGTIIDNMYNDGDLNPLEIAKMGQFSENVYFGKPCGLMDQSACAYGGLIALDFREPHSPQVEEMKFDLKSVKHRLCITDTGGDHANLTHCYSAIPAEMKAVAKELNASYLSETSFSDFWKAIPSIREKLSDRALLRAMHFTGTISVSLLKKKL